VVFWDGKLGGAYNIPELEFLEKMLPKSMLKYGALCLQLPELSVTYLRENSLYLCIPNYKWLGQFF